MSRKLKLKINGESPRSLFLAYVLAKFNCEIYLFDTLINPYFNKDYSIFSITNFSKSLLSQFDMWNEFENITYSFTSLSIRDNLVSEQLLLRPRNFSKKNPNTIGWTFKYSDFKKVFINKLKEFENVYFISKDQLIDETLFFDYEFNFNNYERVFNSYKSPLSIFNSIDEQIIIFNAFIRANVDKRLYEINTTNGSLILTPLNKNQYQVIWKNASNQIQNSSINSKSLFLDNLTAVLPNELKIDQIIGEIKCFYVCHNSPTYIIKKKSIYFNENKFKSNTLCDLSFDIFLRNILRLFNNLENIKSNKFVIFYKTFSSYLFYKYIESLLNITFSNLIINILKLNNSFIIFLHKLIFKRLYLLKIFIIRNLINYDIKNLIK